MSRFRAFALAAAIAVSLTTGIPAASAALAQSDQAANCSPVAKNSDIELTVDNPIEAAVIGTPAVQIAGTTRHTGLVPGSTVSSVTVRFVACEEGHEAPEPSGPLQPGSDRRYAHSATFEWNGPYLATVTAQGSQSQESIRHRRFSLAVPPAPPTGVKAGFHGEEGVAVSWDKNPEPDMVLYEVRRAAKGESAFTTVAQTTATLTTLTDQPPVGDWRYVVLAIRRGEVANEGLASGPSNEAPVAVTTPPTTGSPTTSSPEGGTPGGTGSSSGSTPSGAGQAGTGKVDLSNFAALLDSRRQPTPQRIEPPDPGFAETLPFAPQDEPALGAEDEELGVGEPNRGVGQRVVSNPGERRRLMSFVAISALLFVISMIGLWVRGEVNRADELDALDPNPLPVPDPDATISDLADPELVPVVAGVTARSADRARRTRRRTTGETTPAGETVQALPPRRTRRTQAPIDAPSLDVHAARTRPRTRTTDAQRTAPVVSSRPADNRRQSGATVRTRR